MKRSICVLLAAAMLAALASISLIARATHQRISDPDDTKGRFDIRVVDTWGAHRDMGFEISTIRRWTTAEVWDAGFFGVHVDSRGTSRTDYYVLIRSTGRGLEGLLFKDRERKRDVLLRKVPVWRPDRRSVRFRFPWDHVVVGDTRIFVRWYVSSIFTNDYCLNVCIDRAPDDGTITTIVKPTPTPTVTPTVTPSS